ncbi:hypothetical protein ALC60_01036 [Trachymyrmex zeteki]|uniref:Uncharacterized protein n=1 Tax=Mycetomoellerius zeteki TaxID=64791 RepID=A0A151XHR0_9HYME|nr:hypothetical protein ALC60_01036 [Trachymyrmex zeteki]
MTQVHRDDAVEREERRYSTRRACACSLSFFPALLEARIGGGDGKENVDVATTLPSFPRRLITASRPAAGHSIPERNASFRVESLAKTELVRCQRPEEVPRIALTRARRDKAIPRQENYADCRLESISIGPSERTRARILVSDFPGANNGANDNGRDHSYLERIIAIMGELVRGSGSSDECRNFAEGHRRVCGPWPTFRADNRERAKLFQTSRRWSLDRPRFLPDESSSLRKAVSRRGEGEIEKEKKIIVRQKGKMRVI